MFLISDIHGFHCLNLVPSFIPGSISSCDAFLNVFQSKGLRQEVICPCASSPEALTVAIRRYSRVIYADSLGTAGHGYAAKEDLGVIAVDLSERTKQGQPFQDAERIFIVG